MAIAPSSDYYRSLEKVLAATYPGIWMVRQDPMRFALDIVLTDEKRTKYVKRSIAHVKLVRGTEVDMIDHISYTAKEMIHAMSQKTRAQEVMEKLLR